MGILYSRRTNTTSMKSAKTKNGARGWPQGETPCFVLDKERLLSEVSSLEEAARAYWGNTIVAYSVKTNSLPYLAKLMNGCGVYAEVVSEDEYDLVTGCGYDSAHIVCNGPIKGAEFTARVLQGGGILNLDSHAELHDVCRYAEGHAGTPVPVCLRVNVDIEREFPGESKAGEQGSRFGFCMENNELASAIECLGRQPNICISGLHLHVSTSTRRVAVYEWLAHCFASLVRRHRLAGIRYFDIGGGFYGGIPGKPGWRDYLQAVGGALREEGYTPETLTLVVEPGVSLLAGAFSYYMSVKDVKDTNRSRFVVVDGSRVHIDPLFHKTSYFYETTVEERRPLHPLQRIVGFTCLEYDNLMVLENQPELRVGDVIRCDKLGAYTLSLSPQFISFSPAVYLKEADGTLKCVRKRWTAREVLQSSILS